MALQQPRQRWFVMEMCGAQQAEASGNAGSIGFTTPALERQVPGVVRGSGRGSRRAPRGGPTLPAHEQTGRAERAGAVVPGSMVEVRDGRPTAGGVQRQGRRRRPAERKRPAQVVVHDPTELEVVDVRAARIPRVADRAFALARVRALETYRPVGSAIVGQRGPAHLDVGAERIAGGEAGEDEIVMMERGIGEAVNARVFDPRRHRIAAERLTPVPAELPADRRGTVLAAEGEVVDDELAVHTRVSGRTPHYVGRPHHVVLEEAVPADCGKIGGLDEALLVMG